MWMPRGLEIRPTHVHVSWIRPCRETNHPLIQYYQVYLNGSAIPNFILFSCPFTPWVRHLPWTDLWSDSSTCLLRNVPRLIGQPRVINVVRARGIYSVINLLERSVPSSSLSFPLYEPAFLPLILYLLQRIYDQSATITFDKQAYHIPSASVIYTFPTNHLQLLSTLHLLLNSRHFLDFAHPSSMQIHQCLRVYPSRVGDRCLVRQVTNRVSTRGWATMRCFFQVRITLALQVKKGIC